MAHYLPLALANEFIARAPQNGVTHMKLHKLVYMALGNWLRGHDETFLSENPQVWQYGPVFKSLYHDLKHFKSTPIKEVQAWDFGEAPRVEDAEALEVVNAVWNKWRGAPATRLSDITHLPGSPWHQIAKKYDFEVPEGTEIPTETIKRYFRVTPSMAA